MNLDGQSFTLTINKRNKLSSLDKFINKTNTVSYQDDLFNKIKAYEKESSHNSYTYHYNKRKNCNDDNEISIDSPINNKNSYPKKIRSNSYDNNKNVRERNMNNLKIYSMDNSRKKKAPLISLNKYMNQRNEKQYIEHINNLVKLPFKQGTYSYKKSNNINNNQIISPKKNKFFTQKFININNNNNLRENSRFCDYTNNMNLHLNTSNLQNYQNVNISYIKRNNNNSSIHHINSSLSLNIENISNNNEIINNNQNYNNIRKLMLKNKINNQNNQLNYGDEEQDNKNICVNKSTKSTKSRSLDLSKYIIKPKDTKYNNIIINKNNSFSSINKKINQTEEGSFEGPLSNQDSLQLHKLKSNEFEEFVNYKDNNINNHNFNYFINENNNENYKYNKENRRLIVEYLKVIKNKYNYHSLEELCKINNINQNILNLSQNQNTTKSKDDLNIDDSEQNIFLSRQFKNKEKIDILNFLTTPRIMFLITEINEKMPYIFSLSPSIQTYENGIESYLFKWSNINDLSDKTSYNILHLKKCKLKDNDNKKFFIIFQEYDYIEEDENYSSTFIIDALSYELANNYVKGLNYLIKKDDN